MKRKKKRSSWDCILDAIGWVVFVMATICVTMVAGSVYLFMVIVENPPIMLVLIGASLMSASGIMWMHSFRIMRYINEKEKEEG